MLQKRCLSEAVIGLPPVLPDGQHRDAKGEVMSFLDVSFALFSFLFFHTWIFYPLTVLLLGRSVKGQDPRRTMDVATWEGVSVILPVFNGASQIQEKIRNLLEMDYPGELEIIIVSDGSTDDTVQRARQVKDSRIRVIEQKKNQGKSAAQNLGIQCADFPFLLLTDIGSRLEPDALTEMVVVMRDDDVQCVGSNVQYARSNYDEDNSSGLYWKIEEHVRGAESRMGVLLSVCGSAILVRKSAFKKLDPDTGDDFIIPMDVALQGGKTRFAPAAIVHDMWPALNLWSEIKVRRRITLRNLLGVSRRIPLLNPFRFGLLSFSLVSHKLLRWFSPFLLALMLAISLVRMATCGFYLYGAGIQVSFYLAGGLAVLLKARGVHLPKTGFLSSFLVANYGMFLGIIGFFQGRRIMSYTNDAPAEQCPHEMGS
jgi:cellulose synthase/poly-beta-1,6-N-acetylglucosamine synthase-like glycosyltransferase